MKKTAMLMAALLLLASLAPAMARTSPTPALSGTVLEVNEDGSFLMDTAEFGPVLVKTDDKTEWPGLHAPEAGAWLTVVYNGAMTRSIPPQITALSVAFHRLSGFVLEAGSPEGAFLMDAAGFGQVLVRVGEGVALPAAGDYAQVDFSGVMTMSLPGQVGAQSLTVLKRLEGAVTQLGEESLALETADGTVFLKLSPSAALPEGLAVGSKAAAYIRPAVEGKPLEDIIAQAIILAE